MTKPKRRLANFHDSFLEFAEVWNAPKHYLAFGALWLVTTAVTRAVAMRARGNVLHPNLFIQMIGGPATGKSQTTKAMRELLLPATSMSLIPPSVTRAGLEDYMVSNFQQRQSPDGMVTLSNECIGLSEEMQGILPDQDLGHLTLYNILYDTPQVHKAVTRSNGEVRLELPYCSLFTGAQPAFLATTMPEQAWGMGFMSRCIMVFDTPPERRSAFELRDMDHKLKADLIHDLKQIHALTGWVEWETKAIKLYETWWVEEGGQPIPTNKRLAMGYNGRRELHFLKLAIAFSLCRSNDLIVSYEDASNAIGLLLRTEQRMRYIFDEMTATGSMAALSDILEAVKNASVDGGSIPEADVIQMLMQRFPSTQVKAIIENLLSSGSIIEASNSKGISGLRLFVIGKSVGGL